VYQIGEVQARSRVEVGAHFAHWLEEDYHCIIMRLASASRLTQGSPLTDTHAPRILTAR
jgi:hypothetical protein